MVSLFSHSKAHMTAISLSDLDDGGVNHHYLKEVKPVESEVAHDLWMDKKIRTDEYRAIHLGEAVLIEVKEAPVKKFSEWSEPDRQFVPVTVWHGSPLPFRAEFRNSRDGHRMFHYAKTRQEAQDAIDLGNSFPAFKNRKIDKGGRKKGSEWDQYFDCDVHEVIRGRDFFCSTGSAKSTIARAAEKVGMKVSFHSCDANTIVFSSELESDDEC